MKNANWIKWITMTSMLAGACTTGTEAEEERGGEPGEYTYILDHDPYTGAIKAGGSHTVVVPGERGKEESYSSVPNNSPTRLHTALTGEYTKYDPALTEGETDWDVFPSQWWNQAGDGIARRWTGGNQDRSNLDDKDNLSPAEKYDLLFHPGQTKTVSEIKHWYVADLRKPEAERPEKHSHPAVTVAGPATKWELENHGLYQDYSHPDSWWGHCNGWASYAVGEDGSFPKRDITVRIENGKVTECTDSTEGCILVRMGDIEALMTEVYFSDQATFAGQRCNERPDEIDRDEYGRPTDSRCRDLNSGTFHIAAVGLLNRGAKHLATGQMGKPAFIIDHNYDYQVWNFPVKAFKILDQEEISEERANELVGATGADYSFNPAATKFARIKLQYTMVSDGVGWSDLRKRADQRSTAPHDVELNYVLEMDSSGKILGGEWIKDPSTSWGEDSKKLHPDFFWMPVSHRGWGESADDTGGSNDNPFLSYTHVKALLNCANDPATCAPAGGGGGGGSTNICIGQCGGQAAAGCWCDDACVNYGDCCQDDSGSQGNGHGYVDEACAGGGGGGGGEPANICEGHCGEKTPQGCWCDTQCQDYGDCCQDAAGTKGTARTYVDAVCGG